MLKPRGSNQLMIEGDGSAFAKDCLERIINHLLVLLAPNIIFILLCTLFCHVVLKVGSQDPIFGPDFSLVLFQLIEMLMRVSNFFEFE